MNKLLIIAASVTSAFATSGCSNWHHSKDKASITTETTFTQDRDQKIKDRADDLRANGIPADVADRRAAQQVPLMTTTTSQTGNVQKEKAAREKFEKDLAKSTAQ